MTNAAREPLQEAVLQQLERIFASADFDTSARAQEFLRFVVQALLDGKEAEISQHAIAMGIFGRDHDFDPTTDPIVRMQAGRVRRALEHYYLTRGAEDSVLISLPKGTYVPSIQLRSSPITGSDVSSKEEYDSEGSTSWPTLLLTPFRNLNSDSLGDSIAQGLTCELASELNNYQELQLMLGPCEEDARPREVGAQFEVRGTVSDGAGGLKISVQLLSGKPAQLIWAQSFSTQRVKAVLGVFLDDLAHTVAATIAAERGVVARHIAQRSRRQNVTEPGAYDAILQYQRFIASPSPETYGAAMSALRATVQNHPDCGCCWSYLARICAEDYGLWITHNEQLIQDALSFAKKGVQLDPADQRARGTLSYVYLINDQLKEARHEAEAALAINPDSLFMLEGIGYLLTLSGDWDRGCALSRKAVQLNPFHLPVVHSGLWLDALRRQDFEEAYWQSLEFSPPEIFWAPLMQTVALAFLGRRKEASALAGQILTRQPEFLRRGRWLIRRFVKFDELVERIEQGLSDAGLRLRLS